MKIAALYDIHGNLPALEAVLNDVAEASVDMIVFGGDLAWGPMPRETLEVIMSVDNARFVRGNADREVAGCLLHTDPEVAAVTQWCHGQLDPHHHRFLEIQPTTVTVTTDAGPILFCHGTPRSDTETITTATPTDRVEEALTGVEEPIVVCGHTHAQFQRAVGAQTVVNAGSVGLPFGAPGAYWALIDSGIELRCTPYDYAAAGRIFIEKGGPGAAEFAEEVKNPPPLETAAELWG